MINCSGCSKEFHNAASACPYCGVPKNSIENGSSDEFLNLGTQPLRMYAKFDGRARRKEYWYFTLIYLILTAGLSIIGSILNVGDALANLGALAMLLPYLAVASRRLHDTNHSAWWMIVPVVNLIFFVSDSKKGSNRFGPNPK